MQILATILLALSGIGCVLHAIATWKLHGFLKAKPSLGRGTHPITFWRALKPGLPDLIAKLDSLAAATRADDQILLGVDEQDAARCREWRQQHPNREITIVLCERGRATNPKISKFLQMEPEARHAHWLLTDSEATLTSDLVEALRAEWQHCGADVLTAGYRFVGLRSALQRLDALPSALTLWPGLMLAGRLNFTLGACTALRATDLQLIGGWAALRDLLAEDHELGKRLTAAGRRVALSRQVLDLDADPLRLRDYLRHQHRVAVTYRVANPCGTLGLPIFQVLPLAALATLCGPSLWPAALLCVLIRFVIGISQMRVIGLSSPASIPLIPLVPFVEALMWLVAWLPCPVYWAGVWHMVNWQGSFLPRPPR